MPIISKTTVRLYPPDVEIIDAWAAANPDPDTGLNPSRPTAIRRMIRSIITVDQSAGPDPINVPASRRDILEAVSRILNRLDGEPESGRGPSASSPASP